MRRIGVVLVLVLFSVVMAQAGVIRTGGKVGKKVAKPPAKVVAKASKVIWRAVW